MTIGRVGVGFRLAGIVSCVLLLPAARADASAVVSVSI